MLGLFWGAARMDMVEQNILRLEEFLGQWAGGYRHVMFSYVALRPREGAPILLAGAINLFPVFDQATAQLFEHESKSIVAGLTHCEIAPGQMEFLSRLRAGAFALPGGSEFLVSRDATKNALWAQFDSGTVALRANQPRLATLRLPLCQDSCRL
jgi:hypothetical protein